MTNTRTFVTYLDEIRRCDNPKILENELMIYDNWPVLLYGNGDELFPKVTQAFIDSPNPNGITGPWKITHDYLLERGVAFFDFLPGTVQVEMNKGTHPWWRTDGDKINGLDHSVRVMFHWSQEKQMDNVNTFNAMALAIAGFGDYILREGLTAKFVKNELNLINLGRLK